MKQSSKKTISKPPPPAVSNSASSSVRGPVPSLVRTIVDGFAFGMGSSIGRNVVNNAIGVSSPSNNSSIETLCESYRKMLDTCFETNTQDCRELFEKMVEICYNK